MASISLCLEHKHLQSIFRNNNDRKIRHVIARSQSASQYEDEFNPPDLDCLPEAAQKPL